MRDRYYLARKGVCLSSIAIAQMMGFKSHLILPNTRYAEIQSFKLQINQNAT